VKDAEDIINCIKSLKLELSEILNSGQKWIITNTGSLLLKEKYDPKPLPVISDLQPRVHQKETRKTISEHPITKPEEKIEKKIEPEGQTQDGIVLVRLCPSETELKNGVPFSDEGGKLILEAAVEAEIKTESIYKTYLCKFHLGYLPEDSLEISKWTKEFYNEMSRIKPKLICCFGERVSQIIGNIAKPIDEIRKMDIKSSTGVKLFFFYDPMYILKKKHLRNVLFQELKSQIKYLN
jgi:uracil-DNA glycosylase family 4